MRKSFVLVLMFAVVLCGCNSKKEAEEEVDYNYFIQEEETHNHEEDSCCIHHEEGNGSTASIEDWNKEQKEKNEAAMLELTDLSESMGFDGAEGEFVIEPSGNSFENNKGMNDYSYLVCYDAQNQCVYYINYGNDDYIYQRKDNKTTLLIEETARYLQLWDNKLYFVHATGEFMTGDVYCYDLSSKQLTKVIEGEIGNLYVDEEGFIFSKYEINEEEKTANSVTMKLNYESAQPLHCDEDNIYKYDDFILQFSRNSDWVELINRKTGEVSPLFSYEYVLNYRVYGSYVIIKKMDVFLVIDLSTGKKTIYDATQCNLPNKYFTIKDYIVKEHIMYIAPSISDHMITIDLETGNMKCIQNKNLTQQSMDRLYLAGDKMYAYLNMYVEGETTFTEFMVSDYNYCFK